MADNNLEKATGAGGLINKVVASRKMPVTTVFDDDDEDNALAFDNQLESHTEDEPQKQPQKPPASAVTEETQKKQRANDVKEEKKEMSSQALGMIEVNGMIAGIEAADTMLKSADVRLCGFEKIGQGLVTVMVRGDIGSVKAAVEAGTASVGRLGGFVASHVISRPHEELENTILKVNA